MGTNDEVGGAGDQGSVFGYACSETRKMLPLPFVLATEAIQELEQTHSPLLLADAKAQCTYDYRKHRIDTFLISVQHREDADQKDVQEICSHIMHKLADAYGQNQDFRILVNPTGRFVTGGSFGDTGVTGRKIIADTYGGMARHGGGAFSGKDPTKVDRSASYMARFIAKNIVANNYADKCLIELSYVIGVANPVSIYVDTYNTNKISEEEIIDKIKKTFDLTPRGIINYLDLENVSYKDTTNYGHFGKEKMTWEKIIKF